jgi:molybdenum cofactor synthesis domain-containing protein
MMDPKANAPVDSAADPTAGIIVIGDEILSGKVVDENAQFLIGELRELGVALRRILVIPDAIDEIAAAVKEFSQRFDFVFTSGGVGPTHDDLTMDGVTRAFDTQMVRDPDLERLLRDYYGEDIEERNLRMADVPAGAMFYSTGTPWPVTAFRNVYILPGIPEIFRRKFLSIRERFRQRPFHLMCVYCNADEGEIAATLDAVAAQFSDVALGSYPRIVNEGWKIKLTLESKERDRVEAATAELVRLLGSRVMSIG